MSQKKNITKSFFQQALEAFEIGDYATALDKWGQEAKRGDVDAQFNLGSMYAKGLGVVRNDVVAAKWYKLAAEQGFARAQANLGDMYAEGRGVPQNFAEAVKWYELSVKEEIPEAQTGLALMCAFGKGTPQNDVKALRLLRLAAEKKGYPPAQFNLGWMYANGKGVKLDNGLAYMWYSLAAAQGYEGAIESRNKVADSITDKQLAEAQAKSLEYFAQYSKDSQRGAKDASGR